MVKALDLKMHYHQMNHSKALVTPSYDGMRWGKILDIYDYPRLSYDIAILVLWSHWKNGFATQLGQSQARR